MTSFYLNAAQIAAAASMAVCASKDDMTPILHAVQITAAPDRVTVLATDRYIVGELIFPLGDTAHTLPADGHAILLSATDIAMLAKLKAGAYFSADADALNTVSVEADNGARFLIGQPAGNFPPVARLFPDNDAELLPITAGIGVNLTYLGKFTKLRTPHDKTPAAAAKLPWRLSQARENDKHSPILATRQDQGATLRAMVQPNLIR